MEYNEEIGVSLEEKLQQCRHTDDFIDLGFHYSSQLNENPNSRMEIWTDGYYLIKVADRGNSYLSYDGQYQENKEE